MNLATGQENDVETQPPTEIHIKQANGEDGVQLEPTEENPDKSNLDTAEERDQNIDNLVPPPQTNVNSATGQENDVETQPPTEIHIKQAMGRMGCN